MRYLHETENPPFEIRPITHRLTKYCQWQQGDTTERSPEKADCYRGFFSLSKMTTYFDGRFLVTSSGRFPTNYNFLYIIECVMFISILLMS
jgi:hypothetical protein